MYDIAIVGGGIVGLATGFKLLLRDAHSSLVLLEKESHVAEHQTGHNSGVIHSGIYYKPGSLKARICRDGVGQLVSFCQEHDLPYELCGKVIVATSEEERPRLHALLERGRANGVPDLAILSREALDEIEPHAFAVEAMASPSTGIVSYRAVAQRLAHEIQAREGDVRTGASVLGIESRGEECLVRSTAGDIEARRVIVCAGLHADRLAFGRGAPAPLLTVPFRGEYFRLKKERRHLVRHMIYPVPDPRFPFLGVHFTRGIDGEIEAGPNAVLALAREAYRKSDVSLRDLSQMIRFPGFWRMGRKHWRTALMEHHRSLSKPAFVRTLQRLVPEITADDLEPGGAGVRAMALERNGELVDDFRVVRDGSVIHVLNAPSPAATASLAIADHILGFLDDASGG